MVTKDFASIRGSNVREQHIKIRLGRGCTDQIFTFCQLLETRHAYTYRRPTIMASLELKGDSGSFDRTTLFTIHHQKGLPEKFVDLPGAKV